MSRTRTTMASRTRPLFRRMSTHRVIRSPSHPPPSCAIVPEATCHTRASCIHAKRAQHAARLGPGLVEFGRGDRVRDDAGTRTQAHVAPAQRKRADQDVEVHVAIAVEIAERTGVGAATRALEF